MTFTIGVSTLVLFAGLAIYWLSAPFNPRAARVGEILFFCGLLAVLLRLR